MSFMLLIVEPRGQRGERSEADGHAVYNRRVEFSAEMVGGFFLLRCQTRKEALAIAAECPAAEWATVEVRELGPCFS